MFKKLPHLSIFAAIFALCVMSVSPAFAGPEQGSTNTKGNDRKEGYENNSDIPQEPNHGRDSDHDGDADSDSGTADEDDHATADDGDNAHPSGKDRSVENGGSANQGKSESNADDSKGPMRYEGGQGDDKPQGPGGTDRDDQDGNNGCGNDDDFDDDSNGWCGKPAGEDNNPPPPCDADDTMPGIQPCEPSVLPDDRNNPSTPDNFVLGTRFSQSPSTPEVAAAAQPAPALLPFTGANLAMLLFTGLSLIVAGGATLKVRTKK